jgi:hypothetical protein
MATLVSDIITDSFLDLGAIAPGETITAAEQTDAFLRLNFMLSSWSTEQLSAPSLTHTGFMLTAGTNLYTLGTGGTLVTAARPLAVTGATSVSGNFRGPVKVMSFDQFAAEVADPLASASVLAQVIAADGSFPSINVRVHPMPAAGPGTLWLDYWMAIAQFATVGDAVTLPDGWIEALHWNLALKLYAQYARPGATVDAIAGNAQASKGALNALNAKILGLQQAPPPQAQGGGQ